MTCLFCSPSVQWIEDTDGSSLAVLDGRVRAQVVEMFGEKPFEADIPKGKKQWRTLRHFETLLDARAAVVEELAHG